MALILAVALALQGAPAKPAPHKAPLDGRHSLFVAYTGSLLGLPLMRAVIQARLDGPRHSLRADFHSAGLAAMVKTLNVVAGSQGVQTPGGMKTWRYWHQENDGHKNRHLQMRYDADAVQVTIVPPLHSMGEPPASQAQRLEAMDPLSALLALAQLPRNAAGRRCKGAIKVFDGKQRYDLVLRSLGMERVRTRAFKGRAEKCAVYYVPIAGFDAKEMQDRSAYAKPVYMWLAAERGQAWHGPVRFSFDAPIGRFIIKARRLDLDGAS